MVYLLCFIELIIVLMTSFYFFPIAKVNGRSMLPTYKDGGLLLTTRLFNRDRLDIGEVYVFRRLNSEGQQIFVIKRLTKIHPYAQNLVYFEGDNPEESYDSRQYGFINAEDIIAKVLWQIKE